VTAAMRSRGEAVAEADVVVLVGSIIAPR